MSAVTNRAERREINKRKWMSKLKKLWNSNFFFERVNKVKSDKSIKYQDMPKADSFADFKKDRFGVMLKNTGTICSDKRLDIQEEHKRNLANRKLTKEDQEELDECVELMDNPYSFEKYCGACDNFGTESCPHLNKVTDNTVWKNICDKFWD